MGEDLRGTGAPFQTRCSHPQVGTQEKKCVPGVDLLTEPERDRTGLGENLRGAPASSLHPWGNRVATSPHLSQEPTKGSVQREEREPWGQNSPHTQDREGRVCRHQTGRHSSESICVRVVGLGVGVGGWDVIGF